MPLTPEGMDSIRRFNPGLTGFTLEDQARFIAGQNTHSQFPKIEELVFDVMAERVMKFLSLTALRQIASLLIDHGADVNPYQKFKKVFSGHYHTRSDDGKIYYLGNPYEMFWNDVNDTRGFVFMETDDMSFEYVNNPYQLFHNVYYDDTPHQLFDATEYHNKIIKVIVKNKSDPSAFEKFIDKLYDVKVADLKVIENYDFNNGWVDKNEDVETEDTFSILNKYIEEAEFSLDKSQVKALIRSVYEEACEMV